MKNNQYIRQAQYKKGFANLLLVGIVVVLIAVSGYFVFKKNSPIGVKDCGIDTKCFITNFKLCTPSKIYGGATEIVSGTPESCNVKFLSMDDPKYTDGQRLSMQCNVKNTNLFKDEEINGFGVFQKASICAGSLYDFYVKISNSVQKQ